MIKGVNKRIIEINNTDSLYFEKAIFYLKPNVRELPTAVTEREIDRFISRIGLDSCTLPKRRNKGKIILMIVAIATISAIAAVFFL